MPHNALKESCFLCTRALDVGFSGTRPTRRFGIQPAQWVHRCRPDLAVEIRHIWGIGADCHITRLRNRAFCVRAFWMSGSLEPDLREGLEFDLHNGCKCRPDCVVQSSIRLCTDVKKKIKLILVGEIVFNTWPTMMIIELKRWIEDVGQHRPMSSIPL